MKKLLIMLTFVFVVVFSAGATVEAGTTTITVKKADATTVRNLDKQLKKGKKFIIKVKGSKTASKKLIKKINVKLKKENKYSVKMNSNRGKTKKGYTNYTVSADNAKLYKYTIALLADMYHSKLLEKTVETTKVVKNDDYDVTFSWHLEKETEYVKYSFFEKFGNKDFCDLSTMAQAWVVTRNFPSSGGKYMTYDFDKNISDGSRMIKLLLDGNARGVCMNFAICQMEILSQLSIDNYYASSRKEYHAQVGFIVKNSSGKELCILSDYGGWGTLKQERCKKIINYHTRERDIADDWVIDETVEKKFLNSNWTKEDIAEVLDES